VLRQAGWDVEANGLFGAPPISALQFLGLGRDRVVRVATDPQGRIVPAAFTRAMAGANGPAIVIIQAGQINTGAFDPIEAILPEVRARNAWVHVDGAFGLWVRACAATAHLAVRLRAGGLMGH
jgi:glutamate/tyrosine decarboxylase-like PLP-dependent enzyme